MTIFALHGWSTTGEEKVSRGVDKISVDRSRRAREETEADNRTAVLRLHKLKHCEVARKNVEMKIVRMTHPSAYADMFGAGSFCAVRKGAFWEIVLFIVVVLADHKNLFRNQKYAEENPTPNCRIMGDVAARDHGLHESLGTRPGYRHKIHHELVLRHTNARILNHDGRVVRDDLDEEIRLGLGLFWIGGRLVPDLSSRRKISLLEYRVSKIKLINCWMSALKAKVSDMVPKKHGTMMRCEDNKTCTENGCEDECLR